MTATEIVIVVAVLDVLLAISACWLAVSWPDINPFRREEYRPEITLDPRGRNVLRARF